LTQKLKLEHYGKRRRIVGDDRRTNTVSEY
jgi:hypothetical protein